MVANTARTVSLNCRTLAKPAAKATSASGRSVVSIRVRAVCARWARASAWAPAPDLGDEQPVQLALAVAEPGGEPADALAVDGAVADQPHRPAHGVGADVPLRRAGGGVGPAPPAGPEAGPLGGGGGGVEATLRRFGVIAGQLGRQ